MKRRSSLKRKTALKQKTRLQASRHEWTPRRTLSACAEAFFCVRCGALWVAYNDKPPPERPCRRLRSKPKRVGGALSQFARESRCSWESSDCYGKIDPHHVEKRARGHGDYLADGTPNVLPACRYVHHRACDERRIPIDEQRAIARAFGDRFRATQ